MSVSALRLTSFQVFMVNNDKQTANSISARDDGFLLILTCKRRIISSKQHPGHIEDLRRQIYLLQR